MQISLIIPSSLHSAQTPDKKFLIKRKPSAIYFRQNPRIEHNSTLAFSFFLNFYLAYFLQDLVREGSLLEIYQPESLEGETGIAVSVVIYHVVL